MGSFASLAAFQQERTIGLRLHEGTYLADGDDPDPAIQRVVVGSQIPADPDHVVAQPYLEMRAYFNELQGAPRYWAYDFLSDHRRFVWTPSSLAGPASAQTAGWTMTWFNTVLFVTKAPDTYGVKIRPGAQGPDGREIPVEVQILGQLDHVVGLGDNGALQHPERPWHLFQTLQPMAYPWLFRLQKGGLEEIEVVGRDVFDSLVERHPELEGQIPWEADAAALVPFPALVASEAAEPAVRDWVNQHGLSDVIEIHRVADGVPPGTLLIVREE